MPDDLMGTYTLVPFRAWFAVVDGERVGPLLPPSQVGRERAARIARLVAAARGASSFGIDSIELFMEKPPQK